MVENFMNTMRTKLSGILICSILILSTTWVGSAAPPQQSPPIPIQYGATVEETVSDEQPIVTYVFDASVGDQIVATAVSVNGDLDPLITLTSFDRTVLATDDNSGGDNNAQLSYTTPAEGAYLLNVTRSAEAPGNTNGLFQLTLIQGAPPPTIAPTQDGSVVDTETLATPETPSAVETSVPETTINTSDARLQRVLVGSTVRGNIADNTNFNLYWFIGRANQEIVLTPESSSPFSPLFVLYTNDFTEIFRGQPGQALNVTLTENGIFFITAATLQQGNGGQYTFTLTERLTAESATTEDRDGLVYGDSINGAISNINPTVRYRFRGGAGDSVTISMTSVSGDLDSFLLLVDASGTTLTQDDNSGSGETNAQIVATLPNDGDYFIIATRRGQEQGITSGNFLLILGSDAPPRAIPTAAPQIPPDYVDFDQIRYGDTANGSISNAVYWNSFVFYGDAGDRITVEMTAVDTSLDPLLIILDDQLIPLAENDDIADGNRDSRVEFQLPKNGYYAIVATRFEQDAGTSTGDYELSLSRSEDTVTNEPVIDQLSTTRFTQGENPSGTFDPLTFASIYSFSAAQGTQIGFAVNPDEGTLATVILTDSRLNYIASSDNGILLAIIAPQSDDYLVFVAPQVGPTSNASDNYFLVLESESSTTQDTVITGDGIPITYGSTVRGNITENQSEIRYIFQGQEGDIAEISMTAEQGPEPLDTLLRLEDSNGNVLAENDDIEPGVIRNSFLSFRLPTNGEYTIVATRFSDDPAALTVGSYNLSLQYQDPSLAGIDRSAMPISYGETLTDTINDETFLYFYFFEGRQFDKVIIEVTSDAEGNLDGVLYLYTQDSTGEFRLLETNDDSPLGNTYDPYIAYTLPRTGGYIIAVTRFDERAAEPTEGSFSISLRLDASDDE